jgi:hypothetical protein
LLPFELFLLLAHDRELRRLLKLLLAFALARAVRFANKDDDAMLPTAFTSFGRKEQEQQSCVAANKQTRRS